MSVVERLGTCGTSHTCAPSSAAARRLGAACGSPTVNTSAAGSSGRSSSR